jgi:signal transduction histidine kinase
VGSEYAQHVSGGIRQRWAGTARRPLLTGLVAAALSVAAATLLVGPLDAILPIDSLGIIYLLPVLAVAAGWGSTLAIATAIAGALAYDYFYIEPRGSFGSEDLVPLVTFMFTAAVGGYVANLSTLLGVAEERRRRDADVRARVLEAADDERRRVVRDLHDGAQQRLVHVVITLNLAREALQRGDGQRGEALVGEALELADLANVELRELAQGIMPVVLSRRGLAAALESLVSTLPLPVDLDVRMRRHTPAVESTAYFVVAEALTNVVKHSRAAHAEVRVYEAAQALRVEVHDDGVGGAATDGGTGLSGLNDRVSAIGGALRVHSPPGAGTTIVATLPID